MKQLDFYVMEIFALLIVGISYVHAQPAASKKWNLSWSDGFNLKPNWTKTGHFKMDPQVIFYAVVCGRMQLSGMDGFIWIKKRSPRRAGMNIVKLRYDQNIGIWLLSAPL